MTVLENLKSRHFDLSVHTAWVDEDEGVATFPLWNLSGQMVGFQQYRPAADKKTDNHPRDSRYFTWRKNKVVGVWGLESWNFSNTLFVTEGVFDAAGLLILGILLSLPFLTMLTMALSVGYGRSVRFVLSLLYAITILLAAVLLNMVIFPCDGRRQRHG